VHLVCKGNGYTTLLQSNVDNWLPHLQAVPRLIPPVMFKLLLKLRHLGDVIASGRSVP